MSINVFVLFFLFITHEYPRNLATIDFTFTLLFVIFILGIFPLMLIGKVPIYPQDSYGKNFILNTFFMNVILTSVLRFPITYGLLFLNMRLSKTQADILKYSNAFKNYTFNPFFNVLTLTLFLYYIYYLFYQNKRKLSKLNNRNGVVSQEYVKNRSNEDGLTIEAETKKSLDLDKNPYNIRRRSRV